MKCVSVIPLLLLAVVAPARAADDWPMFRGNPSLTGVAGSSLPQRPDMLWKYETGEAVASSAAIDAGVVYIGCDDGTLYALDLASGRLRWKSAGPVATQPSSSQRGSAPIQSSPCVGRDLVYFGDEAGVFHALDRRTGAPRWSFATGAEIISSANCVGQRVLFGSYDGHLYCLHATTGTLLWNILTDGKVHGTPAVNDDKVIFAGCDGRLHVARLSDGASLCDVPLDAPSGASAAILNGRVFVGTMGNQVFGVDVRACKRVWAYERTDRAFPFYASAAVTKDVVLLGGRDKMLHALDAATGKARWTFATQGRVDSSPVIVGERVFFGSADGRLYGLRIADGTETWRFEAGAPIMSSPAVAAGRLVVASDEGTIFCFGAKPRPARR